MKRTIVYKIMEKMSEDKINEVVGRRVVDKKTFLSTVDSSLKRSAEVLWDKVYSICRNDEDTAFYVERITTSASNYKSANWSDSNYSWDDAIRDAFVNNLTLKKGKHGGIFSRIYKALYTGTIPDPTKIEHKTFRGRKRRSV